MSHFTVTVALPGTLREDEITEALAAALAPYDENKEVPRYVKHTRAELIEKGREEIAEFRERAYEKYMADPVAYAAECRNLHHLDYVAGGTEAARAAVGERHAELVAEFERMAKEEHERWGRKLGRPLDTYTPRPAEEGFPAKLEWTDEQVHAEQVRWYEKEDIGPEGEVYSEYNPLSKWDWYAVGGRWANHFAVVEQADKVEAVESYDAVRVFAEQSEAIRGESADRSYLNERDARPGKWVDVARKYDIDFTKTGGEHGSATYAFLTSEGKWVGKGEMGWFGMSHGDAEQEKWQAEYDRLVAAESDNAWFVLVDAHI
ncbi:hypothetical protein NTR1_24 [Nocardia phage NTR1]|nr:hypothetical protein NTR1_24 [Nocardia phage NTR1]